jgi:Kef-type K+ transport system membrane component KefB
MMLIMGAALLVGYAAHVVGARTHVPRVTLLLLIGLVCGPSALDIVPDDASAAFPLVAELALAMVGFLLGEEFISKKSQHSAPVLRLAVVVTLVTAVTVSSATYILGASLPLALVLGGVATATAPAATLDLIRESRSSGPLTDVVLGVVAADDVLGVLLFSALLAVAEASTGGGSPSPELVHAAWEIGGAIALGVIASFPMCWVTGRLRKGEPAALEALGFVLLVAGTASLLGVSLILACMVLGGALAYQAKHYTRAVHEIEGFSSPLMALFFFMSGFHLDLSTLRDLGVLGGAYCVARLLGRLLGSLSGPWLGHSKAVSRRVGWCLLPQAGIAIGLSLLAAQRLPSVANVLMSLVVAATVVFEIVGPLTTRMMLSRAGELHHHEDSH